MRSAKGDEGRHVEAADADDRQFGNVGPELKLTRRGVIEGGFGFNPDARQYRFQFLENAAFRHGENQGLIRTHSFRLQSCFRDGSTWHMATDRASLILARGRRMSTRQPRLRQGSSHRRHPGIRRFCGRA